MEVGKRGAALCSLLETLNEDPYDGHSLIDERLLRYFGLSPRVDLMGDNLGTSYYATNIMFGKLLRSQVGGVVVEGLLLLMSPRENGLPPFLQVLASGFFEEIENGILQYTSFKHC
ncbi:UNVERIFIED_CONTAM: hypothetical protein Sangu_1723500 [Sesamum angustifolium]|uniref:Uncharacterized protein n=1 Tax=Sesamum angustifolium TaxID=2727405 RepID=A0AAW2MM85_9LAMI